MNYEKDEIPVTKLCYRFEKTTLAYYKSRKTSAQLANREDLILLLARRERIVNPMAGCEKILCAIGPAMAEEGVSMGLNSFYKLMKKNGLMVPKRKKYRCTTTKRDRLLLPSPNLVKGMTIDAPDQVLCPDITQIYTEKGFLSLSLMMDMFMTSSAGHSAIP